LLFGLVARRMMAWDREANPNISPNQVHRGRESAKSCCAAIT
jgi:hypothetical protein